MDIWNQLMQGFATAGTPVNLLWAFVGCALGTAVGVLPGIGPATAVAMLLPITAKVEATASNHGDVLVYGSPASFSRDASNHGSVGRM